LAGNAGSDRVEDAGCNGAFARVWDRRPDSAGVGGSGEAESGNVVSRAFAVGAARMDQLEVGSVGEQPQGEVLYLDSFRAETVDGGDRELGTDVVGDREIDCGRGRSVR